MLYTFYVYRDVKEKLFGIVHNGQRKLRHSCVFQCSVYIVDHTVSL